MPKLDSTVTTVAVIALGALSTYMLSNRQANQKRTDDVCKEKGTKSRVRHCTEVTITLPEWAREETSYYEKEYNSDNEKMALAIHLSARNVEEGTGGPFGSAIFYENKLISIGMNRVVNLNNATLHGETVAIQMAQKQCHSFSFQLVRNFPGGEEKKSDSDGFELFTSCEPCAMCLGATLWSGVTRLVCAATKDDAMRIGFDEGPVFPESYKYLEDRGIKVVKGVLRDEAAAVLTKYGETGVIYNA